jgi:hypothetical protein
MAIALSDLITNILDKFKEIIKNPISFSIFLAFCICLMIIFVFMQDNIHKYWVKIFKVFLYTSILILAIVSFKESQSGGGDELLNLVPTGGSLTPNEYTYLGALMGTGESISGGINIA